MDLRLAAISVDTQEASRQLKSELGLEFHLLRDETRETLKAWGLFNARERGGIAYPATFVVERSGRIVFRSLDRIEARADVETLLAFLRTDSNQVVDNKRRPFTLPKLWDLLAAFSRYTSGR
jgi:peroxiredoxin